ncbi:MAG: AtpZ/AtpI family protein [Desulfocucumaceae bacterium]
MVKKSSPVQKYINFGLSFGLTMAITVYLLYQGGAWLDNRFNTAPVFMFIGILLAIAAVFKRLFAEVKMLDKDLSQDQNQDQDKEEK